MRGFNSRAFFFIFIIISLLVISLSSAIQLALLNFEDKANLTEKIYKYFPFLESEDQKNKTLNRVITNFDRQIPPKKIEDLKFKGGEHKTGIWTSPFDWPVMSLHSVLLPNEKILTYGSLAIKEFDRSKDIRENKEITLSSGLKLMRDNGFIQYKEHNVNGGVDFAIWDPKDSVEYENFQIINKPILLDAFCSIARVVSEDLVFLLGGSFLLGGDPKEPQPIGYDTQNATTLFNPENNEFTPGEKLKYKRWYGSLVRLADDRFIMVGGKDVVETIPSIIPEILEKDEYGNWKWRSLPGAASTEMFGEELSDEWSYPKSFLSSDGNVFGISYNKLWSLNPDGDGSIKKVGEIELATGGLKFLADVDKHGKKNGKHLTVGTIGSGIGSTATAVMIDKDKVVLLGGDQTDGKILHKYHEANNMDHTLREFFPSNQVRLIDISDSTKPIVTRLKGMNYPRSNSNTTIMPNGQLFVNGGTSFNELTFSVFTPEIYDPKKNEWKEMQQSLIRRNYHSSTLLLPDGRILVSGGDVWNAEIYYPPYLFTVDWEGKTILAKRPKIVNLSKNIEKREKINLKIDNSKEITHINMISAGSSTHSQPVESKFLSLSFEKFDDKTISFSIPEDKNIIQNGAYLIFAINASGTPSEGKMIILQ